MEQPINYTATVIASNGTKFSVWCNFEIDEDDEFPTLYMSAICENSRIYVNDIEEISYDTRNQLIEMFENNTIEINCINTKTILICNTIRLQRIQRTNNPDQIPWHHINHIMRQFISDEEPINPPLTLK